MRTKKILIIGLSFAFALSLAFTGCTAKKPVTPNNTGNKMGMTQSDNLARAAQTVSGVTSARAVVLGTIAYVGVNLDRNAKLGNTAPSGVGTNNARYNNARNNNIGFGEPGPIDTGVGTTNGTLTGTGTTGTSRMNNRTVGAGTNNVNNGNVSTNDSGLIGIGNNRLGNTSDNISNIKRQVASAVRTADASITTVYVSTDPSFMNRLDAIYKNVRNGRTVTDFRDELNSLVRGITPERT